MLEKSGFHHMYETREKMKNKRGWRNDQKKKSRGKKTGKKEGNYIRMRIQLPFKDTVEHL